MSLYEPRTLSHCAPTEHERIVAALAAGDARRAVAVMTDHQVAVESRLTLRARGRRASTWRAHSLGDGSRISG